VAIFSYQGRAKSLAEMDAEVNRLKRNLDRVAVEAREHFQTSKTSN
jgi:hypothetical protein